MSIESDIAAKLQADGVATLGADMVIGPMRDRAGIPDALVAVLLTGGFPPEPLIGGRSAGDIRQARVQIRYRSPRDTASGVYTASEVKAQAIFDAVHKEAVSGYVGWQADEPVYIEQDEQDRHHWAVNVTIVRDTSPP